MLWRDSNHADFQMFGMSIQNHRRAERTGDFSRFRERNRHTHIMLYTAVLQFFAAVKLFQEMR